MGRCGEKTSSFRGAGTGVKGEEHPTCEKRPKIPYYLRYPTFDGAIVLSAEEGIDSTSEMAKARWRETLDLSICSVIYCMKRKAMD